MARERAGRLIAVESAHGRDAERGAAKVRASLKRTKGTARPAVSHWDASGTFFELQQAGRKDVSLSARTLLLLYASDLSFRLRWEITPALAAGQTVIAAPYVGTAIAVGEAAGLPRKWLLELFRFAPPPDSRVLVKERRRGIARRRNWTDGFPEFGAAALDLRKKAVKAVAKNLRASRRAKPAKG